MITGRKCDVWAYQEPGLLAVWLSGCFGNVIAVGHTVNQKAIRGKDIVYSMDGFVLEGFTPTKEWRKIHGRKNTPQIGESLEIEVSDGKEE
jgi:hypothetical protein